MNGLSVYEPESIILIVGDQPITGFPEGTFCEVTEETIKVTLHGASDSVPYLISLYQAATPEHILFKDAVFISSGGDNTRVGRRTALDTFGYYLLKNYVYQVGTDGLTFTAVFHKVEI